jgi:hypothetical protein
MERMSALKIEVPSSTTAGGYPMKKALLITAATLFVLGQAYAQNQPTGQNNQPNATNQSQKAAPGGQRADTNAQASQGGTKKAGKSSKKKMSSKRASHKVAHRSRHHRPAAQAAVRQGQPQQQSFGQQQSFAKIGPCKKGKLPDGITCM